VMIVRRGGSLRVAKPSNCNPIGDDHGVAAQMLYDDIARRL
jgi:hypothetical protein